MATTSLAVHDVEFASLFDVVDPKLVVSTLLESLTTCLTAACQRDGIELSAEQINRFAAECANNGAQAVLGLELVK